MTQLEMGINLYERTYGVDNIPGALVKGLNRKRVQDRRPRMPQARKTGKNALEQQADSMLLW
jgi:hypothetical protein